MDQPTPFLSGTNIQYAWDSTSLGYFKTCPRLYYYVMIEGWQLEGDNIHLRWGGEYHKALEDYDAIRLDGNSHDDALRGSLFHLLGRIQEWDIEVNPDRRSERLKTKEALVRSVIWYLDQFKDDPAQTVVLENGSPATELSFKFELDWGPWYGDVRNEREGQEPIYTKQPYLLCGHLDRVVKFNDELFVMDRKTTTSTLGSYYFDQFEPNNQMSLYTIAGQVVINSPVRGVIIDAAQIGVDFSRFVRSFIYRTPDQVQEWIYNLHYWFEAQERCATESHWPMNDTACGNYGGCRFREVCSKSPQVREQFLKAKFKKGEPWNPLIPR